MANAELISSAIAGGLGGLHQEFSDRRKEQHQADLAQMRGEIQQMIAQLNDTGRTTRNTATNATRETVAETAANSRQAVADTNAASRQTVSGQNNDASMARVREQIKGAFDKASMEEGGRNARWAAPSGNATLEESGRNARWATPSGNAQLGSDTTRRGQDMSSATSQRGQDLNFSLGQERNFLTDEGQQNTFALGAERNRLANDRNNVIRRRNSLFDATFGGGPNDPSAPVPPTPNPVTAPSVAPPAAPVRVQRPVGGAPIPVTPRAVPSQAVPKPKADLAALTLKASTLLAQFQAEKDPVKRTALQQQLADLRAQIQAARGR